MKERNQYLQMKVIKYVVAFCITVFFALSSLIMSAFLPQGIIQQHILESLPMISEDVEDSFVFDRGRASQMDYGTDLMILRTSMSTNKRYLGSVLTNPVYTYEDLPGVMDIEEILFRQACDIPHDGVWFYSRYWMGFRAAVRLALTVFNYSQIKRYLAFAFFTLFMVVTCSLAKKIDSKLAFIFAMSIVLVRPHIIATSMQFTCCFLIGFLAMLLVPWVHRRAKYEALFFMEVGMLTMYFDFYTVPLITLGFPQVYLYALKKKEENNVSVRQLLRNVAAWFLGYGLMWIAKLILTTVMTSENALLNGFRSFAGRVGIQKDPTLEQFYSLKTAFEAIEEVVFYDGVGKTIYLLGVGVLLVAVLWKLLQGHVSAKSFCGSAPLLGIALVPFLWFVITKQPVAIHAFFQYRSIALTYWAGGTFLYFLFSVKKDSKTDEELIQQGSA